MNKVNYADVREKIAVGDVIAFSGNGAFSELIQSVTQSPYSHVGVILNSYFSNDVNLIQIIESTSLGKGKAGVKINRMSDHINNYDGNIYWLPLKRAVRHNLDLGVFMSFLLKQVGKPYDMPQALGSAIDVIMDNREDLDKLFCSELVTAAFEKVGMLENINASEQTPSDVCNFDLYYKTYLFNRLIT